MKINICKIDLYITYVSLHICIIYTYRTEPLYYIPEILQINLHFNLKKFIFRKERNGRILGTTPDL